MPNGINGINVRTLQVSRDQILSALHQIGSAFLLAMDDPELAAAASPLGIRVIYRQHNDDPSSNVLSQDPAAFVQERAKNAPAAAYLHASNELDPTEDLHRWTRQAMDYADSIQRKLCIYNLSTHKSAGQWASCEANIQRASQTGHIVGAHAYLDGTHDGTAFEFLPVKHRANAQFIWTEFAYARDYTDAHRGWRGITSPGQRADFMAKWGQWSANENMALCYFSFDPWDQPTVEQAKAEGFGFWDYPDVVQKMHDLNTKFTWSEKPVTPPVIQIPPNPGVGVPSTVIESEILFRVAPSRSAAILRPLTVNEQMIVYPGGATVVDGYPFHFMQDVNGRQGWASIAGLKGEVWIKPNAAPTFTLHAPFVNYKIVSPFNAPRPGYVTQYPGKLPKHEGCDFEPANFGATCDPVVHIGAACKVTKVDNQPTGYGLYIVVDFGNGFTAVYAHLAEIWVKVGQQLADRQIVGLMGNTGSSSEPHTHVTLSNPATGLDNYVYPKCLNPENYLAD